MLRFILCISVTLAGLYIVGCAPTLKLAPEVMANAKGANSIVWGQIKVNYIVDYYSKEGIVWSHGLGTLVIEGFKARANIIFREESTGKEFATKVSGGNFQLFACALPEGKYRLIVDVDWPSKKIGTFISDATVSCGGDGQAIYIGQLGLGTKVGITGSSLFLYRTTVNFEEVVKRFLVDNPEYMGEVEEQIIVSLRGGD